MPLPKINHPLTELNVPSLGRKIKVRPMLGREEKILLMAKESGEDTKDMDVLMAIKQVVNNCIQDDIDIDTLAIFDLEYLFLKLRAMSVANILKVSYKDMEDEKSYDFEIDLNSIEVKFPSPPKSKMIRVDDSMSIKMKYPDSALYSSKEFMEAHGIKMMNMLVRNSIERVIAGTTPYPLSTSSEAEVATFIDELPISVHEKIREFLSELPSLEHVITYTNDKGTARRIVLSSLNDFFSFY